MTVSGRPQANTSARTQVIATTQSAGISVEAINVNPMTQTGVPGLYAAGDAATSVPPSMAAAVASGHLAGAAAVAALAAGY